MGTPATCNGYAMFDTAENAEKALVLFEEWAAKANEGELPEPCKGGFCIEDIETDEESLRYTVESPRYENCVWQCECIRDFLKTQSGVIQVEQDITTVADSVNWYGEDKEND